MISELRRQVNGKEGKFIKVSGDSRRQCSSGKKHKNDKSHAQSQSTSAKKIEAGKNKQNQKSKSSTSSNQKSKSHKNFPNSSHQSRSKSVDAHHQHLQDQWMLRRQDHEWITSMYVMSNIFGHSCQIFFRSSTQSLSDLSETDSWGEKLRPSRESRSRSKSRSSRENHRDGDSERSNYRHQNRDNVLNKFSQSGVRSGWKSKPQSHLTR